MSTPSNINSLFAGAQAAGTLNAAAAQTVGNIPDLGAQIQAGLGVAPDDVTASEVTLVTFLVDDSGSMQPNRDLAIKGHNLVIDALAKTKQKDGILVHCRYLNDGVIYPYTAVDKVARLTRATYDPTGGTPLYDETVVTLATVVAKAQEFADAGVPCRTITIILTDGADGSVRIRSPKKVAPIVDGLLKAEMHIVAAIGIDDGSTPYKKIFGDMGIPANWILTPGNSESEIRKAFLFASQSAVRASQAAGGGGFSQVAAGGFGTP